MFVEVPRLKVVLMESGVTWLPAWMWRANKTWRGIRAEVPWLEKSPADYAREHVRLTVQPFDAPPAPISSSACCRRSTATTCCCSQPIIRIGIMMVPMRCPTACLPTLRRKILVENALKTYPRLSS